MTTKQQAQSLYCEIHERSHTTVLLIEAILLGKKPHDIVRERITNLSVATIYRKYSQISKLLLNNKEL